MEGGFLSVSIVSRTLSKNIKNLINMEELGKEGKNSYLMKKNIAITYF